MFDVLGVDWGEKRFGLAFADSQSGLIIAADYACPNNEIWEILRREIEARKIKTVVIGRPVNFKQGDTATTNLVDNFIEEFKQNFTNLKVGSVNERGTSKEFLGRDVDKQQLNHLAAVRILEYYFGLER